MKKIGFNKLTLTKQDEAILNFNGVDIAVKQYLPLKEKQDIIDFAIQASAEYPYVSRIVSDASFNLFVVLSYTNIELTTKKEKEDPMKTYDSMEESGLVDLVFQNIPEAEMNYLVEAYEQSVKDYNSYKNSLRKMMDDFSEAIPNSVELIQNSLKDIEGLDNLDILKELSAQ